jgi:hypothetical protein
MADEMLEQQVTDWLEQLDAAIQAEEDEGLDIEVVTDDDSTLALHLDEENTWFDHLSSAPAMWTVDGHARLTWYPKSEPLLAPPSPDGTPQQYLPCCGGCGALLTVRLDVSAAFCDDCAT